jgi:Protein of unknown function (DUF3568)
VASPSWIENDMRPELTARGIALAGGIACGLWLSGCATVAPSVERTTSPSRSYGGGRAVQDFPRPANVVSATVAESMEDLKMTAIKRSRDGSVFKIDARTADNRSVMVTVRPHQEHARVGCRIGWFGDEPLSKAIMERVGIRLELLPPAPIPETPPSAPAPNPFLMRDTAVKDDMIREMVDAPYRDRVSPL